MRNNILITALVLAVATNVNAAKVEISGQGKEATKSCMDEMAILMKKGQKEKNIPDQSFFENCYKKSGGKDGTGLELVEYSAALGYATALKMIKQQFSNLKSLSDKNKKSKDIKKPTN